MFGADEDVYPKESSQFGSIHDGDNQVTLMKDQKIYTEDRIGLKTLDD